MLSRSVVRAGAVYITYLLTKRFCKVITARGSTDDTLLYEGVCVWPGLERVWGVCGLCAESAKRETHVHMRPLPPTVCTDPRGPT